MTALSEYQRLESPGLWRESAASQRRDVVVAFGDATLTITDARTTRPLAHWSLPAVTRRNPGARPAVFTPGDDMGEELEIADDTMVAAISKVHAIIAARLPHPGRLRRALMGGVLTSVVALAVLVLPRALIEHTASVLPIAERTKIGQAILSDITRLSGQPCATPEGTAALLRLRDRLLGPGGGEIVVLPQALTGTRHLPGRIILIGVQMLNKGDGAEAVAPAILAEQLRAEKTDPLVAALRGAGLAATFRLLTTGKLPPATLHGYGETVLARANAEVPTQQIEDALSERGIATAHPAPGSPAPKPVLGDNDWVALQGICGG